MVKHFTVFEQHIRNLEAEYLQEREQVKKRNKRQQRKNRDNFLVRFQYAHMYNVLKNIFVNTVSRVQKCIMSTQPLYRQVYSTFQTATSSLYTILINFI